MIETFPMIPRQSGAFSAFAPVTLIVILTLAVAVGALAFVFAGSKSARFEVSSEGLRLRGDFYGRLIPASALRLDAARPVDLTVEKKLQPTMRTMGTALPGYQAGWFRLRGGEKGLLYVTDKTRVAYVPTTAGYSVLLSVADPAALIASLRKSVNRGGM